jgi:cytochrome c-type biogenesis protein CcmH
MLKRAFLALCLCLGLAGPALAVQPDEILPDPAQEARAREISQGLRCLVCRNENIDDSNADLARDLRLLVRERIEAGDTDEQVVDYVVDRYGEYVLLKPTARGANMLLYIAGPAMLIIGLLVAVFYIRGRRAREGAVAAELSPEEQARLKEIMRE